MPVLSEAANMGDLVAADVELAGMYAECSARHSGLVEWAGKVVK